LTARGAHVTEIICTTEPDLPSLEAARAQGQAADVGAVVSVGGGSVLDLGKALAALVPSSDAILDHLEGVGAGKPLTRPPLPFVALPTTAGTGSEVTKNAVIAVPEAGRKVSLRDDRMLADLAIIDPALMDDAPRAVTLASGLDALVQVIEPYLCNKSNPLTDALCVTAIPAGLQALHRLAVAEDQNARDQMAYVSLCGGLALANAGLGAVHGLAGLVGGRLGAPHGLICGRLLAPVLAENAAAMAAQGAGTARFDRVASWIGETFDLDPDTAFEALPEVLDQWDLPRLGTWLTPQSDLDGIAQEALSSSSMRANPCALTTDRLIRIMRSAA
ncbi:MAG: iron-containing alcohol dehydrogenase, partial [Roseobacter sp.]|nr:iron-containing alcohol dehydrogenase [Roseobacter sp.]